MRTAYITPKTKGHLLRMAEIINVILKTKIILDRDVEILRNELREIRQPQGVR